MRYGKWEVRGEASVLSDVACAVIFHRLLRRGPVDQSMTSLASGWMNERKWQRERKRNDRRSVEKAACVLLFLHGGVSKPLPSGTPEALKQLVTRYRLLVKQPIHSNENRHSPFKFEIFRKISAVFSSIKQHLTFSLSWRTNVGQSCGTWEHVFISGVALCGALGEKDEEGMMQGNIQSPLWGQCWCCHSYYRSKKVYNRQSQHASFIQLTEHQNNVKISQTSLALGIFWIISTSTLVTAINRTVTGSAVDSDNSCG